MNSLNVKIWNVETWIDSFSFQNHSKKSTPKQVKKENTHKGYVYFLGVPDKNKYQQIIDFHGLDWQKSGLGASEKDLSYFTGKKGPVWILRYNSTIKEPSYSWCRDQVGSLVSHFKIHHLQTVDFEFHSTSDEQELASLIGLDLAAYQFKHAFDAKQKVYSDLPHLVFLKTLGSIDKKVIAEAKARSRALNLTRHLVNLPPNELNPSTFVNWVKQNVKNTSTMKVDIWSEAKLKKEKSNLHLAVGSGSVHKPAMIHLKYRPKNLKVKKAPIAFVGKGITFDTGGLDLKPSSAMRLMKKDMGGAATVFGLAFWVQQSQYPYPCDFYLGLAENSVGSRSYRPSDIIESRAGFKVEIDNTDAEGRLVLADCLDIASNQKGNDEPKVIIDVATLTGAIKVALGAEIAGLFSNDNELAQKLNQAGNATGDLNWIMPLHEKYFSQLSSPFADFKNSADGFGGAITAALFLHKFVKGKKWAHLDIYAWADKGYGAISNVGGNAQSLQCLIEFLKNEISK